MVVNTDCHHTPLQQCQHVEDLAPDNDTMKTRVTALSRSLVKVVPSITTPTVQFIHQSVQDFVVEKGLAVLTDTPRSADPKADPIDAVGIGYYQLFRIFIHYLAMDEVGRLTISDDDALRSEFPLVHYATKSWMLHAKKTRGERLLSNDLEFGRCVLLCDSRCGYAVLWIDILPNVPKQRRHGKPESLFHQG